MNSRKTSWLISVRVAEEAHPELVPVSVAVPLALVSAESPPTAVELRVAEPDKAEPIASASRCKFRPPVGGSESECKSSDIVRSSCGELRARATVTELGLEANVLVVAANMGLVGRCNRVALYQSDSRPLDRRGIALRLPDRCRTSFLGSSGSKPHSFERRAPWSVRSSRSRLAGCNSWDTRPTF